MVDESPKIVSLLFLLPLIRGFAPSTAEQVYYNKILPFSLGRRLDFD